MTPVAPLRPPPLIRGGPPRARARRILSDSQNPSELRCLTAVRSSRPARVDRTAAKIIVRAPARVFGICLFPPRLWHRGVPALVPPPDFICVVSQFPASAPCCIPSMFPYRLSPPLYSIFSPTHCSPSLHSLRLRFASTASPRLG